MSDFSHLGAQKPAGDVALPYTFADIVQDAGSPVIYFLPATEDNKPFFNDNLRNAAAKGGGRRRNKALTEGAVKKARDEDRVAISKHCAKSWENVVDAKGVPVEFSQEEVLGFLKAIPDWMFDDLRVWLTDPTNWIPAPVGGSSVGKP